mmetsp:Transcript_10431/g.29471  ORF Transcript_10431/g.29471 Transcript_10431/m.29471 type:complete len:227 (-) Transcript_10431:1568-2248(-)
MRTPTVTPLVRTWQRSRQSARRRLAAMASRNRKTMVLPQKAARVPGRSPRAMLCRKIWCSRAVMQRRKTARKTWNEQTRPRRPTNVCELTWMTLKSFWPSDVAASQMPCPKRMKKMTRLPPGWIARHLRKMMGPALDPLAMPIAMSKTNFVRRSGPTRTLSSTAIWTCKASSRSRRAKILTSSATTVKKASASGSRKVSAWMRKLRPPMKPEWMLRTRKRWRQLRL